MADNPHVNDPRPVQDERASFEASLAYEGPKKLTPAEVAQGNTGIRWVTDKYVAGRPTFHDLMDYIEQCGDEIACSCERCEKARAAMSASPAASADAQDAARYRWLRAQHWDTSKLFVIAGGRRNVLLGTDCPCHDRLDEIIDAAMSAPSAGGSSNG